MLERARHPHQYLLQAHSNPMLCNCIVMAWKCVCPFIPKPSSISTTSKPGEDHGGEASSWLLYETSLISFIFSFVVYLWLKWRKAPSFISHITVDYIFTNRPTTAFFPASTYSVCFSVVVLPKKSKSIWNHL